MLSGLPASATRRVALTVDDGTSADVVGAYLQFIKDSGIKVTFFVNGVYQSWTEHAPAIRSLIESGHVQLANHTWDHPDITHLSRDELTWQLLHNEKFLNSTFGVTGRPFFRPPYGFHNAETDQICADLGYTDITLWYGSLGDSAILTPDQVAANARQWLTDGRIVIGHANHPAVTHVYGQLLDLLKGRHLSTVTLNDAYPRH